MIMVLKPKQLYKTICNGWESLYVGRATPSGSCKTSTQQPDILHDAKIMFFARLGIS